MRTPNANALSASSAIPSAASRTSSVACGCVLVVIGALCYCPSLLAQASDFAIAQDPNGSWTATTDLSVNNANPRRIVKKHSQDGNRTVDKQSAQIRQFDGHFQPYLDIETETLQLDATTVRTTTHKFGRDGNGMKILVQVDEEEKRIFPGGDSNVLRVTSYLDLNGTLRPSRREFSETKVTTEGVEETQTTVMLPSLNGGLVSTVKVEEFRRRVGSDSVQSQQTTLLLDGSGSWQVSETRQAISRQEGNNRSLEEHIFRPDSEGKLVEVSRVVTNESESASGEKLEVVETNSVDVPGKIRDGSLHLVERATSSERLSSTGERTTEQKVERTNPGDPGSGLRVSVLVDGKTVSGPSGEQSTVTVRERDSNGSFGIVSVDTTKSDRIPTIQLEQQSSEKPK
jgi:hypothetical protein